MVSLAGAALVAALIGGCGKTAPTAAEGTPSASTSTTTTTVPSTTTTTTTAAPPPSPAQAAPAECKVADLSLSIRGEDGALGTIYRGLVFTNTGGRTCTIEGFPGVSFVAGDDGHQVGQPAVRDGAKGGVVSLKPGDAATAPVGFTSIDAYDPAECQPTPVRGLRVYPPHDTASAFVAFPGQACANPSVPHLKVLTVHAGPNLN
ncbi:DUF4232 domain-containing protein [Actinocrispum sp. NPDC049592]|uniref:DUF4232 domain-containing protein n=1 Tax=Actinocrispum sp. NPDC049592 TaxID=3154835 RepID=UPI0034190991